MCKQHRCVIPASYYFEWHHYTDSKGKVRTGDKYAIQPCGSEVTYLAGLYRIEEMRDLKYPVFAVLTRTPTDDLRQIHNRMPLILPVSAIDEWISPDGEPNMVVYKAVTELVIEKQFRKGFDMNTDCLYRNPLLVTPRSHIHSAVLKALIHYFYKHVFVRNC